MKPQDIPHHLSLNLQWGRQREAARYHIVVSISAIDEYGIESKPAQREMFMDCICRDVTEPQSKEAL